MNTRKTTSSVTRARITRLATAVFHSRGWDYYVGGWRADHLATFIDVCIAEHAPGGYRRGIRGNDLRACIASVRYMAELVESAKSYDGIPF